MNNEDLLYMCINKCVYIGMHLHISKYIYKDTYVCVYVCESFVTLSFSFLHILLAKACYMTDLRVCDMGHKALPQRKGSAKLLTIDVYARSEKFEAI